jgi:class 3 adenylate cyclase/tetratricopeptide (TPR) repeat protein
MDACPSCGTQIEGAPKFCPECGMRLTEPGQAAREARKVVTVLFSGVTGSTAIGERLDPEAVRTLMTRYFAAMKDVIERHGGTVEKFIGDAVMAVFGIPVLHEDDALRAVRSAVQMRESLAVLNGELEAQQGVTIQTRTGITTGEVVAGDPATGQTLVTGDTVNTAARLEQAANPGEILIGEPTWRLVRDAITAEPVDAVNAKGKALPVAAYRLLSVSSGAHGHVRRMDAPLVGRDRELKRLQEVYRDAVAQRSPQLFTLLGAAGVGKSRLIAEFLTGLGEEAHIIRGRCLPYGEGITYWPLAEALREASGITDRDDRAAGQRKLLTLLDGERDAELLSARLSTAIGLSDEPASQTELFWAVRRTLEHVASQSALVVVFDDIHWAEPTFLDLIDHVTEWSRDAPLFVLASARPELLDARPTWGGGKLNAATVLLEALPADATERLIEALPGGSALPEELRGRIAAAAEGNPLFVEELLAMLVDEGSLRQRGGGWEAVGDLDQLAIPPTIHALLAARLERLSDPERRIAERASVVGRVFEQEAVAALSPGIVDTELNKDLLSLVRKELVRPDRSEVTGGDAFKFRHILIRDAAYAALPKRERAELHERFAGWLENLAADGAIDLGEIIGYHLAEAHRYQMELGIASAELAKRAARVLESAAERATARGDFQGSASLYFRAAQVAEDVAQQLFFREQALWCQRRDMTGTSIRAIWIAASDAAAEAEKAGLDGLVFRLALLAVDTLTYIDVTAWSTVERLLPNAIAQFTAERDDRGLALAKYLEASRDQVAMRFDRAYGLMTESLQLAERTGWRALTNGIVMNQAIAGEMGATPIEDIRSAMRRAHAAGSVSMALVAGEEASLSLLVQGFEPSQEKLEEAKKLLEQSAGGMRSGVALFWALYSMWAGDLGPAEQFARDVEPVLRQEENEYGRRTAAGVVGFCLAANGRIDEAEPYQQDAAGADSTDPATRLIAHRTAALIALQRGHVEEAERCCITAMELLEGAESAPERAETLYVWADVKLALGDAAQAAAFLSEARELMADKGATAVVKKIERRMQRLNGDVVTTKPA